MRDVVIPTAYSKKLKGHNFFHQQIYTILKVTVWFYYQTMKESSEEIKM
jgi:hypothetical protein